jgi:uncharacterized protein YndB with AHSA1/START domain
MEPAVPDRIEKKILLRAPRPRVWRAITEAEQFGAWFGVDLDSAFVEGARVTGRITPTQVDPEVAKLQEPHKGLPFVITIERIEPERHFSFRWHPFSVDPKVDHSKEPTTLVTFELEEVDGETMLRLTESGFSKVPLERRADAFTANEGGWEHQMKLIEKYLQRHA